MAATKALRRSTTTSPAAPRPSTSWALTISGKSRSPTRWWATWLRSISAKAITAAATVTLDTHAFGDNNVISTFSDTITAGDNIINVPDDLSGFTVSTTDIVVGDVYQTGGNDVSITSQTEGNGNTVYSQ